MSQRSAAKRLVNALHQHAQRTGQKQFDVQTLRSVASRVNIKVKALKYTAAFNKSQANAVLFTALKAQTLMVHSPFVRNYL